MDSHRSCVQEEVAVSGLLMEMALPLPAATEYTVRPPSGADEAAAAAEGGEPGVSGWSPVKFALVFAVAGAILMLLLGIVGVLLRALMLQRRKKPQTCDAPKWPEVR